MATAVIVINSIYGLKVLEISMGTTVTTNLALIKPDASESIKASGPMVGWAAQNTLNMDKIDSLFRDDFTNYSPSWTATTANPTLGAAGAVTGKYIRLMPRMVMAFFSIYTGGAGFLPGTGLYRLTLPVAADPVLSAFSHTVPVGKAIFLDTSGPITSSVFGVIYSPSSSLLFFRPSAGGTWDNAIPVVPGQQDRLSGYFIYPTAVP
jgi:hypothetical protein